MSDTLIEERLNHRQALRRSALIYVPGGVTATVLFLIGLMNLLGGNPGAIVAVIVVGFLAFALDHEALAAVRDLRAEPVVSEGTVLRIWTRSRILIFGRIHYILVGKRVFELGPEPARAITEGDRLRVEHWPRTNGVISVHRISAGGGPTVQAG